MVYVNKSGPLERRDVNVTSWKRVKAKATEKFLPGWEPFDGEE